MMSHATKLVLRIVINRVSRRTLHELEPERYGLIAHKGTRNDILRRLVVRSVETQRDVYGSFIDYSKAFDTVSHESFMGLLLSLDVDEVDTCFLTRLYWNQIAVVRWGRTQNFVIGCALNR